ncbi:Trypsin-like peptidase domain [Phytophthora infestans]|uniref:Trypsin-like peptidase domain n=1 Tax=Phytophthora infestans TaxID=4787 RepID=A0A833SFI1_PHYIN|nr:Trypsin-like peptidase domain [Phytophthora infestans]
MDDVARVPHRLDVEPPSDDRSRQHRYRVLGASLLMVLFMTAYATSPTTFRSNDHSVAFTPMETDDPTVEMIDLAPPNAESTSRSVNLGMGCPEFQHAFDSATPGSATPFRSFTLTKGSGYAHVGLRFSKLWMPNGVYVVLRAVEGFDTSDRTLNLSTNYPSGRNYGNVVAPPVLTKEFRIEFYRDEVGSSDIDETDFIGNVFSVADSDSKCFGFVVDSYDYVLMNAKDPIVATGASICAADNSKNAICYYAENTTRTAYLASRSVARLKIPKGSGEWASCTGWLLGNQGHIMTNYHCVSTDEEASGTRVEFMAEDKSCSDSFSCALGECEGGVVAISTELVHASKELDYALLKLPTSGVEAAQSYGYLRLKTRSGVVGEQLYIPQHPMGKNKRIAVEDDYASNVALLSLSASTCGTEGYSYSGDTQTGSSGSPVILFSDHGVVALHHCGEMCANTGIPAKDIVDDLATQGINLAEFDGIDDGSNSFENTERIPEYIPPVHEAALSLTPRLTLDGAIILASGFVTIDKVEFTLTKDTIVSFAVVSAEIADDDTFVDLNGDCRASYLDSVMYLFPKDSSTNTFFVDDSNVNDFMAGGSVSFRDPHKTTSLKKGSYVLAVAPTGSSSDDALAGKAKFNDAPEIYACRTRSSYGSYKLQISSTEGENPFQFTRLPATFGIDPTQCQKTAEAICSG